ncbi:MAG TPA: DEAD/DEAH box helicase [Pseudonocardiaceae bacterium]|nr:DEAD/DEAH box helicase [Pseudonocardiaceae bacterium]
MSAVAAQVLLRGAAGWPRISGHHLQERITTRVPSNHPALGQPCSFRELGIRPELLTVLARQGLTSAFPIQVATLPDALAGRDVLGRGRTGSGKTLAFTIPTITALARSGLRRTAGRPRALVLVPTRELANQVADTFAPLAAALRQRVTTVYGGVGQGRQVSALRGGIDVLVACPGRLEDLLGQGHVHLDEVEVTVLDEADHMADLGFLPAVRRLLDCTPANAQRLLFSATLDSAVDVLVRRYLTDPVVHSVDPPAAPVSGMVHHVFTVDHADKLSVVRELASGQRRSLLFTRTKHGARKLAKQLTIAGLPAMELHGDLSQNVRARNLAAFSEGRARVLVATDIAARGIHVDEIGLVVHVDPPAECKAYLHRSGRTARAGADGLVITLCTPEQLGQVRTLTRLAGIRPVLARVRPGAEQIAALTGPPAPLVAPPEVAPPSQHRRSPAPGISRRAPRRPTRRRSARRAA